MKPRTQQLISGISLIFLAMISLAASCMIPSYAGIDVYAAQLCLFIGFVLIVAGVCAISGIPKVG